MIPGMTTPTRCICSVRPGLRDQGVDVTTSACRRAAEPYALAVSRDRHAVVAEERVIEDLGP